MKTTLAAIRAGSPCTEGWRKLTSHLGGIDAYGLTTPLDVATILESNGFDDALWVLDKACGPDGKRLCHVFACDVAERVLPIFERAISNDTRPRKVVVVKRLWIAGEATDEELFAAWEAARDAASAATRDAARAAARAAVWAATRDADWDARDAAWAAASAAAWDAAWAAAWDADWNAAWAAERNWQITHLHEMLKGE